VIGVSVLSLRPGGLRRQLRYAARRLRIVLVLGGVYVVGSTIARLVAPPDSAFGEFAPPVLAIALGVIFVFIAQDPEEST
jgi:hypothetical protein